MPQTKVNILDDKIEAETLKGARYDARHMSDGERVALLFGWAGAVLPGRSGDNH
jgi:hypothetical protein